MVHISFINLIFMLLNWEFHARARSKNWLYCIIHVIDSDSSHWTMNLIINLEYLIVENYSIFQKKKSDRFTYSAPLATFHLCIEKLSIYPDINLHQHFHIFADEFPKKKSLSFENQIHRSNYVAIFVFCKMTQKRIKKKSMPMLNQ